MSVVAATPATISHEVELPTAGSAPLAEHQLPHPTLSVQKGHDQYRETRNIPLTVEFDIPGFSVASVSKGFSGNKGTCDFVEVIPVGEHDTVLLLADVAGHGARAAVSRKRQVKTVINDYRLKEAFERKSPHEIIDLIDLGLGALPESDRLVTLSCLLLCGYNGVLEHSSAGAHPPLVRRRDGSISGDRPEELFSGFPVGIGFHGHLAPCPRTSQSSFLEPDDVVVITTDGYLDSVFHGPDKTSDGMSGMSDLLSETHGLDSTATALRLYGKVRTLVDDVTVVSFQRNLE